MSNKWNHWTTGDINAALAKVKHQHDPEAARNLIECFYERITEGEGINEKLLLEYVHHAFGLIANNKYSADQAFGLKRHRGQRDRPDTFDRDMAIAAYMILLWRKGWTWIEAKGEAANVFFPYGEGENATETAYRIYRIGLEPQTSEFLESLLPKNAHVKPPAQTRRGYKPPVLE